jgi:cell division transport system ATP-binding protein
MIQLFHVSKDYGGGVAALTDLTIKIAKGEFVFITGSSGAGKSTLLKMIFGSETPTSGQTIVDGRNYSRLPASEVPALRRKIGFIFQDFKLIHSKSVFDNVALPLKILGLGNSLIRSRVLKALTYVNLKHRANFKPLTLSGGEQQRVAVARALVKDPAILLADEPTGNLDPELALKMMELFQEVNSRGTTVVIATHDKAMIERMGKRTINLHAGRLDQR